MRKLVGAVGIEPTALIDIARLRSAIPVLPVLYTIEHQCPSHAFYIEAVRPRNFQITELIP